MQEEKKLYAFCVLVAALLMVVWLIPENPPLYLFTPDASAATSSSVTVTASVATSISCSTNVASTAFGTLTSGAVATSTGNASTTMACANDSLGCILSINDTGTTTQGGGLWNSTSSKLIPSPNAAFNATATLTAGTEGYGLQGATTSAGNGALLNIATRFYQTGSIYGGLTTTTLTLASTTASSSAREVVITHGAAIAANTPGGTYNDTITYSCTAN